MAEPTGGDLPCLEYEWGCLKYEGDRTRWCVNCRTRLAGTGQRPTEPGWYWLNTGGEDPNANWQIVEVGDEGGLVYSFVNLEYTFRVDQTSDRQWGGKITQEPAPGPPPPF